MLYITQGPDGLVISGYPIDAPEFENNHVEVLDAFGGRRTSYEALRNMVTNVLRDAGVPFTEE